jgi:hypothetical protein
MLIVPAKSYSTVRDLTEDDVPRCPPLRLIGKGSDMLVELPHSHFALHSWQPPIDVLIAYRFPARRSYFGGRPTFCI